MNELPLTDPRSALLRRVLFSAAEDLVPDKQGRILVSQRLREHAQLENEIVIAGMSKFIELWQPANWAEKVVRALDNAAINGDWFTALNV